MVCCKCNNKLLPTGVSITYDWFDADHIIPLCKGGNHSKENLQLLCQTCHALKSAKEQSEYQINLYMERNHQHISTPLSS